jgi:hypothetical protein
MTALLEGHERSYWLRQLVEAFERSRGRGKMRGSIFP